MKVHRRKTIRRHRNATSPSPPPIPPPPDLITEIEQSVEARDELEAGAARFAAERDQSKSAFLRLLAGELRAVELDANRAFDRFTYWQAQDARATRQSDALYQLLTMFKKRVEQFESNSKGEAVVALQRIIERLAAGRDRPGADKNAIDKRIERLRAEQDSLRAPLPPVPPREPKDKTPPPQRPAKSKPQPGQSGKI